MSNLCNSLQTPIPLVKASLLQRHEDILVAIISPSAKILHFPLPGGSKNKQIDAEGLLVDVRVYLPVPLTPLMVCEVVDLASSRWFCTNANLPCGLARYAACEDRDISCFLVHLHEGHKSVMLNCDLM
jgi:hypothetical protein